MLSYGKLTLNKEFHIVEEHRTGSEWMRDKVREEILWIYIWLDIPTCIWG